MTLKAFGLVVLSHFLLNPAHADQGYFYSCEVKAEKKDASNGMFLEWKKKVLISDQRYVDLYFPGSGYNTLLKLKMGKSGQVEGKVYDKRARSASHPAYVNEVSDGEFESTSARGSLSCSPARDYHVVFYSEKQHKLYLYDPNHYWNGIVQSQPRISNTCVIGNLSMAAKMYADAYDSIRPENIEVSRDEKRLTIRTVYRPCLKWQGYREDQECVQRGAPQERVQVVKQCGKDQNPLEFEQPQPIRVPVQNSNDPDGYGGEDPRS